MLRNIKFKFDKDTIIKWRLTYTNPTLGTVVYSTNYLSPIIPTQSVTGIFIEPNRVNLQDRQFGLDPFSVYRAYKN